MNTSERDASVATTTVKVTTVVQKFLMALTGLALTAFLVSHLLGNLALYKANGDKFNAYAYFLEQQGVLLYVAEIGLLVFALSHVYTGLMLKKKSVDARGQKYRVWKSKGGRTPSNSSSRSMAVTGMILLIFIIIHVKKFKFGPGIEDGYVTNVDGHQMRDLHRLVVETYQNPFWVGFYMFCMGVVGWHLRHGVWSAFQSLGWVRSNNSFQIRMAGMVLAAILALGFFFIPLWIYIRG